MYRPTDRRIPQIDYSYQPVNPNIGRMPQQQGGGFLSGLNNGLRTMNALDKMSGRKMSGGLKGLVGGTPPSTAAPYAANSSPAAGELARAAQSTGYAPEYGIQGAAPMKTKGGFLSGLFGTTPTSSAAPVAANASPAASELALSAQSAGYSPAYGLAGGAGAAGAAAPTAASIASGATSMGAPAASLAAAESAGAGAGAAGAAGSAGAAGAAGASSAVPIIGWGVAAAILGHELDLW